VESRYLAAALAVGAALAVASLFWLDNQSMGDSLRIGIFSAVSALTTTGFSAAGSSAVAGWPIVLPVILIVLMLIGGSAGSTAGGIKLMRLIIILKLAGRELARLSHPHGVVRMRYGRRPVDEETLRSVWGFLTIFMTAFAAISVALSLLGVDLQTAISATAATLSNTGAALSMIDDGSAYGDFSTGAKWVLSLSMILGRLELVTVLVLLTPAFWRN
jgi:trk system potassium uptake protein TrkH